MADPLDPLNNLKLPYDYSKGDAQPTVSSATDAGSISSGPR
jgi:hypothetical protein